MRLSPKSIFFCLVLLGLPIAVTVGWILGEPATTTPSAAANPGGAGGIGAAPDRDRGERPVNSVDYAAPSAGIPVPSASGIATVAPLPSTSAVPSPALPTLPPLTDPPVPTPTMVTSEPPSPSPTPSTSPSADPSGIDAGGLFRSR